MNTLQPEIILTIVGALAVVLSVFIAYLTDGKNSNKKELSAYKALNVIVLLLAFCCLVTNMFLLSSN